LGPLNRCAFALITSSSGSSSAAGSSATGFLTSTGFTSSFTGSFSFTGTGAGSSAFTTGGFTSSSLG